MTTRRQASSPRRLDPDRRPLTEIQAQRLSAMSGVPARDLVKQSVVQISDKFKWQIDPELLLFRRICGQVVKRDPVTGVEYPVPFATVHVEDTDCSFLGLFPVEWPWAWFFPVFCTREEIATVVTDECGRFCVFVPRWEIDWILRWRRERICFPDIFVRPSLRDILDDLHVHPEIIRPPKPEPDPPPFLLKDAGMTFRRAEEMLGREVAGKLAAIEARGVVGGRVMDQQALLDRPAFTGFVPPPIPASFKEIARKQDKGFKDALETASQPMRLRSLAAEQFNVGLDRIPQLNPRKFIGPFRRCFDVFFPEWMPIFDVPDITFRVTQDVDMDGDEEVIYSEGYFDVRWNVGAIPDVTLEASAIAVAGPIPLPQCDTPEIACEDQPAIIRVGLMPLEGSYHDAVSGYALRPNRPHPSGLLNDPPPNPQAETPYLGTLQLYGCNHIGGAVFYRLKYSLNGGPFVPFTGLSWTLSRLSGGSFQFLNVSPDALGWYPVLNEADGWAPEHLLLNWPTGQSGVYTVQMELGNAAKAVIDTTPDVNFVIDNDPLVGQFTSLAWRRTDVPDVWHDLELICPVVERPTGSSIEFRVGYIASASHLRDVQLTGGGCGGGNPERKSFPDWSDPPTAEFGGAGVSLNPYEHWHTDPDLDNSVSRAAIFSLAAARPQGAYSFNLQVDSRAFNPAGGDGGFEANYKYDPVYRYIIPQLPVAVVDV